MSQQFEQREERLGKKDFAITQYEEIVSKLEEQLKLEEQEVSTPYFEPVSSPEVDSLLNIFLRLNARLKGVSQMLDDEVFEYTPEEKKEEDFCGYHRQKIICKGIAGRGCRYRLRLSGRNGDRPVG